MDIKFIKGVFHLGYAYRAGDTAGNLPEDVKKMFVKEGYAVPQLEKKREKKPEVKTTHITRSKKRPVKK